MAITLSQIQDELKTIQNSLNQAISDLNSFASSQTTPTKTGTGQFEVKNGKIYDPDGLLWVGCGINASNSGIADKITNLWPGINIVRVPVPNYDNLSSFQQFVNTLTAKKVVVEFEYHPWPMISEPPQGNYQGFITNIANTYKSNPYVWLGSMNEPQGGDLTTEHANVYTWARGVGFENMILLVGGVGGGNPGATGPAVLRTSAYTSFHRVAFDMHFYGWVVQGSTDQNTVNAKFLGNTKDTGVNSLRQIRSADGVIPIMNAEFGPSTDAAKTDANANQVIQAVTVYGVENGYTSGYAGWNWDADAFNALQTNGNLTTWGNQLKSAISHTRTWLTVQNKTSGTTTTPSANGTVVTGQSGTIADSSGNIWAIDASGVITVNSIQDTTTSQVVKLVFSGGSIFQQNKTGSWWKKAQPSDTWQACPAPS